MKKYLDKKYFYILGALFIGALFAYITFKTPLAGDDWGYYLNSQIENPFKLAFIYYKEWSGRFFSELWGFIVPANKWLWNILNPLFFVLIYLCIYKLGLIKDKPIISVLLIIAAMLSVDDNLRMETYTWIMGTTYVVPLCFSLIYFVIAIKLFESEEISTKLKVFSYLSNILLFVIGLMMENIAAAMIGGIAILIIYSFVKKKKTVLKYLFINLFFSVLSFLLCRLSPGSDYRLRRDGAGWLKKTFFERISSAYPNFLEISFINNKYIIAILSVVLIGLMIFSKKKKNIPLVIITTIINVLGIITVFSFIVIKENNIFIDGSSIYSMIFWPIYVINAFVCLFNGINDEKYKLRSIFFLTIGGASVLVMLFSPIYGSRSAIYLVYYLILVCVIVINDFELITFLKVICVLAFSAIIIDRTNEYISKYRMVGNVQLEREEIIAYYKENPQEVEAWIPRFPIYTIHGGDIEPYDWYHMQTFQKYYELPQDYDRIVFY